MRTWEYKQASVWNEDYEETLNQLGAEGWEVTQTSFHPGVRIMRHPLGYNIYAPRTSYYTVLFRRRKQASTPICEPEELLEEV